MKPTSDIEKPSELFMRCMADFGDSEATVAFCLWRDENSVLNWRASHGCNTSEIVGMLELAKQQITLDWIAGRAGGDSKDEAI